VSQVFRHGALRLYLLKLLDEQPRHGYEVISLLEDRFMGLYAPSAGTVYPRLARLESEALVEHEVSEGRKVYRLTAAGREELARNVDELASLELDLTASVSELARGVRRQVRDSARDLRAELKQAAREVRRETRSQTRSAHARSPESNAASDLSRAIDQLREVALTSARLVSDERIAAATEVVRRVRDELERVLAAGHEGSP
jgi:DNA-binding PadR family transcriptional regulator